MRQDTVDINMKQINRFVSSDTEMPMKNQVNRLLASDSDFQLKSQMNRLLNSDTELHEKSPTSRILIPDSQLQSKNQVSRLLAGSDGHIQMKNHNYMMSPMKMGTKSDGFERKGQAWFVATELQSDLVVEVGDISFNLHKFPLLSRSGHLNRLVFESRDTQKDHIKLVDMPGGPEAFELAAKFCYGVAVDLTAANIAALRCAAEYLEMTEDLEDGNLISKTEAFLSFVVLASWKDSITVLQSCEGLRPWAENLQIVRRCSESIAWKACTDPRGISWSFTGKRGSDNDTSNRSNDGGHGTIWNGAKDELQASKNVTIPQDWWFEDVASLSVEYFVKLINAIRAKGMRPELVGAAAVRYVVRWVPGLSEEEGQGQGKGGIMVEGRVGQGGLMQVGEGRMQDMNGNGKDMDGVVNYNGVAMGKEEFASMQRRNRGVLEGIVGVLPMKRQDTMQGQGQQGLMTCGLVLRMLRMANMLGASAACKRELERRAALQLEQASLPDLLIPCFDHATDTLFDVDLVHRILQHFLTRDAVNYDVAVPGSSPGPPPPLMGCLPTSHAAAQATTKVARLVDSYLAEVARDSNLSVAKFQALAEELPEYARACDDGLYRAIDTYLKAHPGTSEVERKRLCRLMDCQKLSLDACMHAAQNERLPLRVVVQVLFCEQVKLRNAITGSALARHKPPPPPPTCYYDDSPAAMAPPPPPRDPHSDNCAASDQPDAEAGGGDATGSSPWSTARRDIRALKQDVERMKSKYTELQADYATLQQEILRMARGGAAAHAPPPAARRMSGGGGIMSLGSGLKKLVRAPGHIFGHPQNPQEAASTSRRRSSTRLSMDESSCANHIPTPGGPCGPPAPPTPSPSNHKLPASRRWRYSIS